MNKKLTIESVDSQIHVDGQGITYVYHEEATSDELHAENFVSINEDFYEIKNMVFVAAETQSFGSIWTIDDLRYRYVAAGIDKTHVILREVDNVLVELKFEEYVEISKDRN